LVIGLIIFTALVAIMLPVLNYDYLYAVQDHSLFLKGRTFMYEKLAVPGGLLEWLGCYLTQFFYYPWLGSAMLLLVWLVSIVLAIRTFRLFGALSLTAILPAVALLCSVIDIGYWMYYQKSPGYYFSQSIGYLITILAVWGCNSLQRKNPYLATPYIIIWTVLGYCCLGWWALLGSLIFVLQKKCHVVNRAVSFASIVLVPWLAYYCYSQFRIDEAWWIGFPLFQYQDVIDWHLSVPFFVIAFLVILFGWIGDCHIKSRFAECLIVFVLQIVIAVFPFVSNVNEENFSSELRMYRAMDDSRWQDVVDEFAAHGKTPTHQMVMMKNTALLHLGQLGERMFESGNCGRKPDTGKLKVRMTVTAGPMLYYQNGLVNFAYRWGIENEVERGLSVKQLKMMVRCAIWNEENELAVKYLTMLKSTLFHRSWARERERMIYEVAAFRQSEEYKAISPLVVQGDSELDFDNGLCEEYIINNYAYLMARNALQQEAAVCYAMMLKDDELMKFQIANYYELFPSDNVPKHILEAVDLLNQEHSPSLQKFISDYRTSLGMGRRIVDLGKDLKKEYGGTYWWYYYFYNDFNIY